MTKKQQMNSQGCNKPDLQVVMIKLSDLRNFWDNPFRVEKDMEFIRLRESISREGILVPLLVRENPYGLGYEIISGHRRKLAAELEGLERVPAFVKVLDDDQAVIELVDSNMHREKILPSEKAFAYKMKLEAMKHQGKRNDFTFSQNEKKASEKYANEILARQVGESRAQISRYIRLTFLIPKLLEMVDDNRLAFTTAVELSFLEAEEQYEVHAVMDLEQIIPNLSQANRLKRMSQQKSLNMDTIFKVLIEEKPNQKEQIKLPRNRIDKYFPKDYSANQKVELIEELLKKW